MRTLAVEIVCYEMEKFIKAVKNEEKAKNAYLCILD